MKKKALFNLNYLSLFCSSLLLSYSVSANTGDKVVVDELQRLKNQAQFEKDEKGLQEAERLKNLSDKLQVKSEKVISDEKGEHYFIAKINVDLAGENKKIDFQPVIQQYQNKQLTVNQIFQLTKDLTEVLYKNGYITSAIGLKSNDISNGQLDFIIHWGKINQFLLDGSEPTLFKDKMMLAVLPNLSQKPLNIHDIDQLVETLNTVNKSATIDIVADNKPAQSNLNVKVQRSLMPKFSLGVNNSGAENNANGRNQATFGVNFSDLLGTNDSWAFSSGYRFYKHSKQNSQKNYSLSYTQPFSYAIFEARVSQSDYEKMIQGINNDYSSYGKNKALNLKLSQILFRNQTSVFSVYTETEFKTRKSYLIDRLTNHLNNNKLTLGVSYISQLFGGNLYTDLSYANGLNWFSADKGAFDEQGDKTLKVITANINWHKKLPVFSKSVDYQLRIAGQYGFDYLYSDSQFSIGDEYTVRGFKGGILSGDKGGYISQTISYPISLQTPFTSKLTPFVGYDLGRVYNRLENRKDIISGMALGVKFNTKQANFSLTYSRPIRDVNRHQLNHKKSVYYFNATILF